jgi:glycosyltransferase involved in cell wall biosynthesis
LPSRLSSIANQTVSNYEAILLDDASNDSSITILTSYLSDTRFQLQKNPNNSGSTFTQWNKGVAHALNEYVWIAESDDIADSCLLDALIKKMESDSKIVLAYCQSNRINEKDEITGSWKDFTSDLEYSELFDRDFIMNGKEYISKFLIHRNTIPNASAVLFRKSIFQKVGGAPANLKTSGDWLTWLKMLCYGKVAFVAEPLNYFRYHDRSVIARAHQNFDTGSYREKYDRTMRKEFIAFLKQKDILLSPVTCRQNKYYISLDDGNEGLYRLKNREYLNGWRKVVYASLWPRLQSGFIKKALRLA